MEQDGNKTIDFNIEETTLINHRVRDTMITQLGLAVAQFAKQMVPDMGNAPVVLLPGAGLRSIVGILARATDNQLV